VAESANLRLLDVLERAASDLLGTADADACVLSRAVGDVLIVITQATADGRSLNFGQGFLVSEYPATAAVLRDGTPCSLTLEDEGVDEAEAALLRELGYASLLMLPLELGGERWGLVELYRRAARHFEPAQIDAARTLLARF
jgi:GAF domain-containing protein